MGADSYCLHSLGKEFDIKLLKVQCLGIYLEPFWGSIWNLLAQPIMEPFEEPCLINVGTLNGSLNAGTFFFIVCNM